MGESDLDSREGEGLQAYVDRLRAMDTAGFSLTALRLHAFWIEAAERKLKRPAPREPTPTQCLPPHPGPAVEAPAVTSPAAPQSAVEHALAEEREAIALLVEGLGYKTLAGLIRARGK